MRHQRRDSVLGISDELVLHNQSPVAVHRHIAKVLPLEFLLKAEEEQQVDIVRKRLHGVCSSAAGIMLRAGAQPVNDCMWATSPTFLAKECDCTTARPISFFRRTGGCCLQLYGAEFLI